LFQVSCHHGPQTDGLQMPVRRTARRARNGGILRSICMSFCLLWLVAGPLAAELNAVQLLPRDLWPKSRTGEIIRQIEPLRRTVLIYDQHVDARILIQFADGSAGNAWAFEVKEWLIAFGIEASHVILQPGPVDEYSLALSVIK